MIRRVPGTEVISINLPECAGDYFVGLIICPSHKDLTSATECPQPAREGGGRWAGAERGEVATGQWAAQAGIVRYQPALHCSHKTLHGSLLPSTSRWPTF